MAYGRFQGWEYFRVEHPGSFTSSVDYNLPDIPRDIDVLENSKREEIELRAAAVCAADEFIDRC
jgi:hypothetical protein